MRRSKKAYLKTLEAFFAFFITFIFVVFVVLKGIDTKGSKTPIDVLYALEQRDDFRTCVYANNATCAEDLVKEFIPAVYNYKISIGIPAPFKGAKDIYTETVFIVSNSTNAYDVVYLYYWSVTG